LARGANEPISAGMSRALECDPNLRGRRTSPRSLRVSSKQASRNDRDFTYTGGKSTETGRPNDDADARFGGQKRSSCKPARTPLFPHNGHAAITSACRFRAISGLMRRNQSASARKGGRSLRGVRYPGIPCNRSGSQIVSGLRTTEREAPLQPQRPWKPSGRQSRRGMPRRANASSRRSAKSSSSCDGNSPYALTPQRCAVHDGGTAAFAGGNCWPPRGALRKCRPVSGASHGKVVGVSTRSPMQK
jgi:hypothetical protein